MAKAALKRRTPNTGATNGARLLLILALFVGCLSTLRADSVVTQELYENAQTARDVAASDLRAARFNQQHGAIVAPGSGTKAPGASRVATQGAAMAITTTTITTTGAAGTKASAIRP